MISSLSGTEPSLCFQEPSRSGSLDPPPVKIEVPRPSCSTPVLITAPPPSQLSTFQSLGAPAGLSVMSPSSSNTLVSESRNGASGPTASDLLASAFVEEREDFLAFVNGARVMANVPTNSIANTTTLQVNLQKFTFAFLLT